jgi:hypothetical protein
MDYNRLLAEWYSKNYRKKYYINANESYAYAGRKFKNL